MNEKELSLKSKFEVIRDKDKELFNEFDPSKKQMMALDMIGEIDDWFDELAKKQKHAEQLGIEYAFDTSHLDVMKKIKKSVEHFVYSDFCVNQPQLRLLIKKYSAYSNSKSVVEYFERLMASNDKRCLAYYIRPFIVTHIEWLNSEEVVDEIAFEDAIVKLGVEFNIRFYTWMKYNFNRLVKY